MVKNEQNIRVLLGKNAVKRQQSVYAGLGDLISSGAVHAVTIFALTPAEAAAQNGLDPK